MIPSTSDEFKMWSSLRNKKWSQERYKCEVYGGLTIMRVISWKILIL